jgi:superfamily II DNA or RNA helicase
MEHTITAYHAKYFAYELTRQFPSNDIGKLTASLQDAQVDLNPHQVEAALFAFKSPLSNGAILADEVGLGKTIEAGIILSQQWAERKRRLLIICPANLRKQWNQELSDKFFLPSVILETKSFNQYIKEGNLNPFHLNDTIIICSFQFARARAAYLQHTPWDLVVIDEAHRLRNVYKTSNVIGKAIKKALLPYKKVLLTATPLQNSILELYGLVSLIDDYVFGDLKSFKSNYSHHLSNADYADLRNRLQPVCQRSLRRQVLEYVNYTNRRAILEEYYPTHEEHRLYEWVSGYLQLPKLYALPCSQRQLIALVMRKLLASSSFAIYGTLDTMVKRLELLLLKHTMNGFDDLEEDYETLDELADEWPDDEEDEDQAEQEVEFAAEDLVAIEAEIALLKRFRDLAGAIKVNSKAEHLLTALEKGFEQLRKLGANQKALIFTESRRTQDFLLQTLEANGYLDRIVLFNGSNSDSRSKEIYQQWIREHKGTDKITGSPTADKRAAIVEYFRNTATIMIATEAGAEGVNLQFCSLVVNYDLPWNPQRIEQRIGRCHRYGQKSDVVVVNFLNRKNAADVRVYELLDEKFRLFDGVFGASDEVLGAIGNGMDFEKRIAQIYNECRTPEEIQDAFDILREELKPEISDRIRSIRTTLLENFDEAVREKLRVDFEKTRAYLNAFEQKLWRTTRYYLEGMADFDDDSFSFRLMQNPFPGEKIHPGPYMILKPTGTQKKSEMVVPDDTNVYRVGHPLAQRILSACRSSSTPTAEVVFDYTHTPTKVTLLEPYVGQTGWLRVDHLRISSFEEEDYLLIACFTDRGEVIDAETSSRLFSLLGTAGPQSSVPDNVVADAEKHISEHRRHVLAENDCRNREFFDVEMDKLELWADDMKISLEREIKDLDADIKLRKGEAKKLLSLETKIKAQREIKEMEKKRNVKRHTLFQAQDEIDTRKEQLLNDIEQRLSQKLEQEELFMIDGGIV